MAAVSDEGIAALAAASTLSSGDLWQLRLQLVGDASAALFVLFVTTTLSVYKPWGMTEYGLRKQSEPGITWRVAATGDRRTGGGIPGRYGVLAIIVFVVLMLLLHLVTRGLHGH